MKNILGYIGVGLRELFWIVIAGVVIFGGITGFKYLGENREVVVVESVSRPITLVKTIDLNPINAPLPIRGEGFVNLFVLQV